VKYHHASPVFWAEVLSAAAAAALASLTFLWPGWIEALTGIDIDHCNGALEWVLVVGFAVVCSGLSLLARREWRRASPASA